MRAAKERIAALDLIRGVAILGILAINIEGFAGPMAATLSPGWDGAASTADQFAFAAAMVLFEGKMRALLSLLFGASLVLFVESAEAGGRNGERLQTRRLIWLAVIGYLHFILLWWGDILFTYAIAGFFALLLRHIPAKALVPAALLGFTAWHGQGMAASLAPVLAEARLEAGIAPPAEAARLMAEKARAEAQTKTELARQQGSWTGLVRFKIERQPGFPLGIALSSLGETLPLMLIGMALLRDGFFTGGWERKRLRLMAGLGIGGGGLLTVAMTALARARGFPPQLMEALLLWWLALPHLMMALGYAAVVVLFAQSRGSGWLADRISAVGRMALSNYLGCTLVMTALFQGWGLGLIGTIPERWLWPFVLGGWVMMLAVSHRWLARHAQGPVEWLWRSLTLGHRLPQGGS